MCSNKIACRHGRKIFIGQEDGDYGLILGRRYGSLKCPSTARTPVTDIELEEHQAPVLIFEQEPVGSGLLFRCFREVIFFIGDQDFIDRTYIVKVRQAVVSIFQAYFGSVKGILVFRGCQLPLSLLDVLNSLKEYTVVNCQIADSYNAEVGVFPCIESLENTLYA